MRVISLLPHEENAVLRAGGVLFDEPQTVDLVGAVSDDDVGGIVLVGALTERIDALITRIRCFLPRYAVVLVESGRGSAAIAARPHPFAHCCRVEHVSRVMRGLRGSAAQPA